jgi:hypothetical protein
MKKICKNCKYYTKIYEFYGACSNQKMEYESAFCYEKIKRIKNSEIEKDKVFYMDYEGYSADIDVGEEFGCIHFEKKEKELKLENTDGYNYDFEEIE